MAKPLWELWKNNVLLTRYVSPVEGTPKPEARQKQVAKAWTSHIKIVRREPIVLFKLFPRGLPT